jgi:hypothetical protein
MNDFLDNLGKTVNETAKKAMKASGDFLELTKTSLSIKFDEAKRDGYFRAIGKIIYGEYRESPESASEEIAGFCACITEIENSIKAQKAKAADIKNKKYCPECGVILAKTVNYCYSCGAKQPEIAAEEEAECCCCCCADEPECCESDEAEEGESCCEDDSCCCGESEEKQD